MLHSMTGYGRESLDLGWSTVTIEIRSLNSRYLDLKIRLPQEFKEYELEIRKIVGAKLERGKIDLTVESINQKGDNFEVNKDLFKQLHSQLSALQKEVGDEGGDLITGLLRVPNMIENREKDIDKNTWITLKGGIESAIKKLNGFRREEGDLLETDFTDRIQTILTCLEGIPQYEAARTEKVRDRLNQNMSEFLTTKDSVDLNRFEQELIFYLEKLDITEEKVRLQQHCDFFLNELADKKTAKGRKLNFISQEIGREINTIGSKANSADIQKLVVEMKDELEKIKEQLANIL